MIEFRVLGPLQVVKDGRVLPLGGMKQRGLLAVLLLDRNRVVPRDRLIDALWEEEPPASAANSVQVYVSKLRRLLGDDESDGSALLTEPPGYALRVPAGAVDADQFERLLAEGKAALAAGSLTEAEATLATALALWRGPALADFAPEPYAQAEIARLEGRHLEALEARFETVLGAGRQAEALGELEALVGLHPLDERLRAQHMRALYRSGRQVQALASYRSFRRLVSEELGLEPGPELRELERAILRQDPSLRPPDAPKAPPSHQAVQQETAPASPVEPAPEREVRKVVTALFCDLSDPTEVGEGLDPERRRRVLSRYLEDVERVIADHGGLVETFGGDGVLAVFGLPKAHEDDALRAARAATEIQDLLPTLAEETGFELAVRAGIDTGEVVAGGGHAPPTGDPVTAAQRWARAAVRGEILLGAKTVRLLGSRVEVEPLVPLSLHGEAEPVQGFRFCELAAPQEPERSLFVGRERELALLHDAFRRASDERQLLLVTTLGPAGIGKSRLAEEFIDSLDAEAQVVRGCCLSYGRAITYWPLVEILRSFGEPANEALELVVAGGATSPQQLAWTVQRALEQAADERPLLVMLEDLHWAESALLDLVDLVCDLSRGYPILLLCLARPELLDQRPGWAGGKLNAANFMLEPLAFDECELLSRLQHPLEPEQRQRVVERAAGNPLFLEELTAFVAEGGGEAELPPRIHALLQARLDLLAEPERRMLACAAVEGVVFHPSSLRRLAAKELRSELQNRLMALMREDLIRPAPGEPEGEEAYRFRHQLIRDAAYSALPKEDRAELHERFADWLEERSGERGELDDICAHHLEQAALYRRELGRGEPALDARAGTALAAAAERARRRPDLRGAASLFRRALTLLDESDRRVHELELQLGLVLAVLGERDEARRIVEQAGRHTPDPSVATNVRLVQLQWELLDGSEGPAAARRACAEAIALFEQRGDHRSLGRAWHTLALAEWIELQVRAAAQAHANAATHYRLTGDRAREVFARRERIYVLGDRISYAAAIRELERLAAEFPGEPDIERELGYFRAFAAYEAGRAEQARPLAHEVLDAWRRTGHVIYAAFGEAVVGWYEALSGDLPEGERLALSGVSALREHGARVHLSRALPLLGEIRILQGRGKEALELADEAEQQGGPYDRRCLIFANGARACAHARLGAIEEAKAAAARAVALAETTDSLRMHASAKYPLAVALAAADELPAALAAAEEAARLYTSLERTLMAHRARALAQQIERRSSRIKRPSTV